MSKRIYISPPDIGRLEKEHVKKALDSNWISSVGPYLEKFEEQFKQYHDIKYAVALNSGTSAIHLALLALSVKKGDTVFCSSFTFVGSANPIFYTQATPIFIDSETETWNMCPYTLEQALKDARKKSCLPKAIIVVHIFGQAAQIEKIVEIGNKYGVPVVEDACESLGGKVKGKLLGTFGQIGTFSFNGNKLITTSAGGMLVTNDENIHRKVMHLATAAKDPAPFYLHSSIGYNYRMSNILAALGFAQFCQLEEKIAKRRAIFEKYHTSLKNLPLRGMPEMKNSYGSRWLSTFLIDEKESQVDPQAIINFLEASNIESRRLWKPLHTQPVYSKFPSYLVKNGEKAACNKLFRQGLCLPSGSSLTNKDQGKVIEVVEKIFRSKNMLKAS